MCQFESTRLYGFEVGAWQAPHADGDALVCCMKGSAGPLAKTRWLRAAPHTDHGQGGARGRAQDRPEPRVLRAVPVCNACLLVVS
jgi:hypothetical protein